MNCKIGLLIVFGVVIGANLACGGSANNPTPVIDTAATVITSATIDPTEPAPTAAVTVSPTTVPTEQPAQPIGDARTEILAAYERTLTLSYRTITLIPSADGDMMVTGEIVPPDALHTLMQTPHLTMEMIIIGTTGWQAMDGVWNALPAETISTVAEATLPGAVLAMLAETMVNPQALGQEQLDGQTVWVYRFEGSFAGVSSTTTLYVDAVTGLPAKQEILSDASGVVTTSTQTITYDDTIVITPPVSN